MNKRIAACPDCDLLLDVSSVETRDTAVCPRCDAVLMYPSFSLSTLLWLTIAGLLLWVASMLMPVLSLSIHGVAQSVSLLQASQAMLLQDEWLLAMLVAVTTIVAPLLHLLALLWLLLPVLFGRRPMLVGWVFRALHFNHGWLMLDVFFVGLLVTAVKLSDMADVIPGWSLLSFIVLMVLMTAMRVLFNVDHYWRMLDQCR